MITKELLSEVLNFNFQGLRDYKVDKFCFPNDTTIAIGYYMEDGWKHINIYELAHKCKKWAFNKGYELQSRIMSNDKQPRGNCCIINVECEYESCIKIENAKTEQEAIFQACNWILEKGKNK